MLYRNMVDDKIQSNKPRKQGEQQGTMVTEEQW